MSALPPDQQFEALLDYLATSRGFDFSGYKRPTLIRRVQKRMTELHLGSFAEYEAYLETHVGEFDVLFNTILINVTSFFRDPKAWEFLSGEIIPSILARVGSGDPIRVWSAGCASGEEAYTLAILLAEILGNDEFRARVKIYATDIDENALATARAGSYPTDALSAVPDELRERYFEPGEQRRAFRGDLRRAVIFGRHDLTRDAPISRLELVTCRNTLMYFNAETQAGVVNRLHYALNPGGYLFLGHAEMVVRHGELFRSLNTPFRIFTKIPRAAALIPPRDPTAAAAGPDAAPLLGKAFQSAPTAQLIVDATGRLAEANDAARATFGVAPSDLGRPFQDLEVSYRPIDLRTPIERSGADGTPVTLSAVERHAPNGTSQFFDIVITPLAPDAESVRATAISFADVTPLRALQAELKRAAEELETAYEELQSSNEELETTNEELQSTVEELETTNEELQSTNEELETTNEELRSSNEELEATNEELRTRTGEAADSNSYLTSIVDGVAVGVVAVDADRRVRTWNAVAEETWGLRRDEVIGRSLYDLDSGLPVDQLRQRIDQLPDRQAPVDDLTITAINRRGRPIRCQVKFTPLASADRPGVVMLFDESADA